jgi:hypothetical protein
MIQHSQIPNITGAKRLGYRKENSLYTSYLIEKYEVYQTLLMRIFYSLFKSVTITAP